MGLSPYERQLTHACGFKVLIVRKKPRAGAAGALKVITCRIPHHPGLVASRYRDDLPYMIMR